MDSFEESVRQALRAPYEPDVDADDFLTGVHRGVRARRTRSVVGGAVATVAVVTAGGYVAVASDVFTGTSTPVAGNSTILDSPEIAAPSLQLIPSSSAGPASANSGGPVSAASVPSSPPVSAVSTSSTVAPPPPAPGRRAEALSLSATGTQHQWVLLAVPDDSCPQQQCAVVQVTKDAGKSWEPLSAVDVGVSARPVGDTVREVRFAGDGTNGWTFGGELLATHDAGASWTTPALPVSGSVTSLEAWGEFVYAVVTDEAHGTASLVRSPVASDDWRTVDLGTVPAEIPALVVSEQVVAVLARPADSDVESLLTSSDGVTWQTRTPCEEGRSPSTLSTTEKSMWLLCSDDTAARARVSVDGGQTWEGAPGEFSLGSQLAARDPSTAAVADPASRGLTLVAVDHQPVQVSDSELDDVVLAGFTNPTTGYVLDANGDVLRTDDGGKTWQPYSLPR